MALRGGGGVFDNSTLVDDSFSKPIWIIKRGYNNK